jgi:hypothetical protein
MELNEEQRAAKREYDRLAKQRSRAKEKLERERLSIPKVADYKVPEAWESQLSAASQAAIIAIREELLQITDRDDYVITGISEVLCGLRHRYTQKVQAPMGIVVGIWFVDALGSEAVEYVHKDPALLGSPTFKEIYDALLSEIMQWSKKQDPEFLNPQYIADVRTALAGEYKLPPEPNIPKLKPEPATEPNPIPSDAVILEQSRLRMLAQLQFTQEKEEI